MAINLTELDLAATGNPKAKIIVTKGWLREVHRTLVAAARAEAALAAEQRNNDIVCAVFGRNWPR